MILRGKKLRKVGRKEVRKGEEKGENVKEEEGRGQR